MSSLNASNLNRMLEDATRHTAPAIVCRVEIDGQLLYEAAYGSFDPNEPENSITSSTLFDYASVTKLFTTTACLRLLDTGNLRLDTRIADIIPEFSGRRPVGATEDPVTKLPLPAPGFWANPVTLVNADDITVRHLLTHSSGLPAWRHLFSICGETPAPGNTLSVNEIADRQRRGIAAICGFDFAYPTGQSYAYSDLGLVLLGEAVARSSGTKHIGEAIDELVTRPLGLSIRYNPQASLCDQIAPTEYCPWRNRRLQGEVHDENASGLGGIAGHAGLFGNAEDLCKLGRVYMDTESDYLSNAVIEQSLRCHMAANAPGTPLPNPDRPCDLTNPETRRGLGWMLKTTNSACGSEWSRRSFGHTGFTGTSLWCDPEYGLAVALLTNRVYNGRDPDPIHDLRVNVHTEIMRALLYSSSFSSA